MDKEEIFFKTPAVLGKYTGLRNRAMRLIFDTQENLNDKSISQISSFHEKMCWLIILTEKIEDSELLNEIKTLPKLINEKFDKTPSQRLRDRLFIYYKQKIQVKTQTKNINDFNEWYIKTLDNIGQTFLDKLN